MTRVSYLPGCYTC